MSVRTLRVSLTQIVNPDWCICTLEKKHNETNSKSFTFDPTI